MMRKMDKPLKSLSHVRLFVTSWTVAHQAPPSMEFLGKSTGVGCHFLLQGIFPTQGQNLGLPHCGQKLYHLSHQGSPLVTLIKKKKKKRKRIQINKIRNEKREATTDTTEIRRTLKDCCEQLYTNKTESQRKWDKCLGRYQD